MNAHTVAGAPSVALILHHVARYYGVTPDDLRSKRRTARLARPRQVAMWLAAELTGYDNSRIGRAIGGRDTSTISYSVQRIDDMRARDSAFRDLTDGILARLRANQIPPEMQEAMGLAYTLGHAFEVALVALAKSNPQRALAVFAEILPRLAEECPPCR